MMLDRLPIRRRLTLWYTAFLSVLLIVSGLTLYVGLHLRLYAAFDDQLRNQAALTAGLVRQENETLTLPSTTPGGREDQQFIRLVLPNGQIAAETGPPGRVPLDQAAVTAALAGQTELTTARFGDEQSLRLVTTPIVADGRVIGVLQLGGSRGWIDEALRELLGAIALIAPVLLLVAFGSGYLIARRALAPVAAITRLAAAVDGRDLHRRLALTLPDDELGQLAATFNRMLARIEAAFEQQRRFTGDAAHELRTPLSLMQSQIDLALARPRDAAAYRDALEALRGDVGRLTNVVTTLLALARSDSGRLPLEPQAFDLSDTVTAVAEQYAEPAAVLGVSLVAEPSPSPLVGDEDLLVQVLVNLMDNALAHTPPEGTITLGCRSDGELVRLWVTDTGQGISAKHLEHVFDRFYRVDPGRSRAQGGAGLGLSICRAIVEAHHGTIALTSEPGQGTQVVVLLPRSGVKPGPVREAAPAGLPPA